MALEDTFQTTLEESAVAEVKTLGDLKQLIALGQGGAESHVDAGHVVPTSSTSVAYRSAAPDKLIFPSYNRWRVSWWLRRMSLPTWILPLARYFMKLEVRGLEHLDKVSGPVVFASNHQSHFDGPAIFSALPPRCANTSGPEEAKNGWGIY